MFASSFICDLNISIWLTQIIIKSSVTTFKMYLFIFLETHSFENLEILWSLKQLEFLEVRRYVDEDYMY